MKTGRLDLQEVDNGFLHVMFLSYMYDTRLQYPVFITFKIMA